MQSASAPKYNIDPQELYRTEPAAQLVKESIPTLARKRARRQGPQFIKKGKAILYPGFGLIDYLDRHLVDTTP